MRPQVQSSVPIVFSWLGWVGDVAQLDKCLLVWPKSWVQLPAPHKSVDSFLYSTSFASSLSTVQWYEYMTDYMTGSQELSRAINSIYRLAQRRKIQDKACLLTD